MFACFILTNTQTSRALLIPFHLHLFVNKDSSAMLRGRALDACVLMYKTCKLLYQWYFTFTYTSVPLHFFLQSKYLFNGNTVWGKKHSWKYNEEFSDASEQVFRLQKGKKYNGTDVYENVKYHWYSSLHVLYINTQASKALLLNISDESLLFPYKCKWNEIRRALDLCVLVNKTCKLLLYFFSFCNHWHREFFVIFSCALIAKKKQMFCCVHTREKTIGIAVRTYFIFTCTQTSIARFLNISAVSFFTYECKWYDIRRVLNV